ncbi:L-fucose isomerase-like protein [Candidatus Vecturithrix granuli]|uniref:L-fucose isomerase-like protein n=1 Tax=Vecturithrix granuli TaxID=1499967 RepID=A0A081C935_VECG1|nr:L-fucose isomerase-like protein [Candidatus Vecturithrix granuli]
MIRPEIAFIVYGVHKDGLRDPMGTPFIDEQVLNSSKQALVDAGLQLVEHELIIASKQEAKACFAKFKKMDDLDGIVLFSGTWVWASHIIAALRDFSLTGKGIVVWTHPGSQGWRPVGGLVLHGALKEVNIPHRFVYGSAEDSQAIERIVSYCRASHIKNSLNMSTLGVFGGRGMGQTCGVADPSQWMKMFGIDIDSRDTTALLETARTVTREELLKAREQIQPYFSEPIPEGETADRSIRLYLAIKKILAQEAWDFYTIQSFPGLADDYSATCFAQSMILNDGIATSTLSDFNTCLTVKLLTDLSSERVYYGDLQHIDKSTQEIKIIGDGACPPSLAGDLVPARFAEHGIPTEGEAGGLSVELVCKPGEGILARLGRTNGEFEMVLARCSVFEPTAEQLEARRNECGIPFWPHAFVTVHADIERLLEVWNNEYAVLGYGAHLYEDIKAFCELMNIRVIAL